MNRSGARAVAVLLPLLAILSTSLVSGCFSVRLPAKIRDGLGAVVVSPDVDCPGKIDYSGPALEGFEPIPPAFYHLPIVRELTVAYAISPIGLWQASRAYSRMESALSARLDSAGFDPARIVSSCFAESVRRSGVFLLARHRPAGSDAPAPLADAEFKLAVEHGLSSASGGFESGVRPWVIVSGTLVSEDGDVLWRHREKSGAYCERIPAHNAEILFRNPERFEEAFRVAVDEVVERLVGHLVAGE